jgi:ketosteroid isomerase-like protein
MTSNETAAAVRALLESYRDAFERLDAAAIADHFAYPSHITGDADEIALMQLSNRQDCLAAVEKVLAMHRELEAPSGSIRDLSIVELSPRLTHASLRMEVHGRAGEALYDFEAAYTLAETRSGWRIAAIAHNQIPRLLECIARRQSGK